MNIILNKEQIELLVRENRYPVNQKKNFLSRCIDGRYENKLKVNPPVGRKKLKVEERQLPALAFPGGDIGQLALVFATGNVYGFTVEGEKLFDSLLEVIGGEKNFSFHTDSHADLKIPAGGCGHWQQIQLDPPAYNLGETEINFIKEKIGFLIKSHANSSWVILEGEHKEGAILLVKGDFGIYPRYFLETEEGRTEVQVFVYHQTLVDERHKALASALLRHQAVKLYPGCDEEYLYQVLSEMVENHLMETVKRLAKGLPIYAVNFKDDGSFEIEGRGKVSG